MTTDRLLTMLGKISEEIDEDLANSAVLDITEKANWGKEQQSFFEQRHEKLEEIRKQLRSIYTTLYVFRDYDKNVY